ncbi:MAG: hypothetical protein Q9192_008052 [Flavoplaca navasiana]
MSMSDESTMINNISDNIEMKAVTQKAENTIEVYNLKQRVDEQEIPTIRKVKEEPMNKAEKEEIASENEQEIIEDDVETIRKKNEKKEKHVSAVKKSDDGVSVKPSAEQPLTVNNNSEKGIKKLIKALQKKRKHKVTKTKITASAKEKEQMSEMNKTDKIKNMSRSSDLKSAEKVSSRNENSAQSSVSKKSTEAIKQAVEEVSTLYNKLEKKSHSVKKRRKKIVISKDNQNLIVFIKNVFIHEEYLQKQ